MGFLDAVNLPWVRVGFSKEVNLPDDRHAFCYSDDGTIMKRKP